jgi:dTDP-4-amino-4,6-dideoxygalactose transaminase
LFAKKFAEVHTAKYAQCVNTGTVAIQAALKAIGIRPGDEVIVPAYTWEGTVGPVLLMNAIPVFVDVDPDTYCLDARLIEEAITPKTKAILPVHLGMRFADMDEILCIARKHGLKVIEDCAHAHGGMWNGKGAGSMGDLGAFSFQSSKLITSGEGGAVITNNLEYIELVQSYINAGRASLTDQYHHRIIGFNYRLGEFQAAVLGPQLDRLPQQAAIREENMKHFETRLQNTPEIGLLKPDPRITRLAPYGYVLKYFACKAKDIPRAAFVAALQLEGIPCDGLFYEPVYKSSLFPVDSADFPALSWGREKPLDLRNMYSCPEADKAAYHEAIWFPHQHFLGTTADVDAIADAIHKVLGNIEELRSLDHKAIRNQKLGRADRES